MTEEQRLRRNEYQREWCKKNPDKLAEYRERHRPRQRAEKLAWVRDRVDRWDEYRKTLKCERCGFDDFRALEHHHRDPSQKVFAIGYGVRRKSWDEVMAEAAKCEVVCSNCHRIEHYRNLPQTPENRRKRP